MQMRTLLYPWWINEEIIFREMENWLLSFSAFQPLPDCEMASRFTWRPLNHTHNSHYAGEFWLIQDLHKACVGP